MSTCPLQDTVIACYLDGDLHDPNAPELREARNRHLTIRADDAIERLGGAPSDVDQLAHHLRNCPTCNHALRDARRLDATLSRLSGAEVTHALGVDPHAAMITRIEQAESSALVRESALQPAIHDDASDLSRPLARANARSIAFAVAAAILCFVGGVMVSRTTSAPSPDVETGHPTATVGDASTTHRQPVPRDLESPAALEWTPRTVIRGRRSPALRLAIHGANSPRNSEHGLWLPLPGKYQPHTLNADADWMAFVQCEDLQTRLFAATPMLFVVQWCESIPRPHKNRSWNPPTRHGAVQSQEKWNRPMHAVTSWITESLRVRGLRALARSSRTETLLEFARWVSGAPASPTLEHVLADARTVQDLPIRLARCLARPAQQTSRWLTRDQGAIQHAAVALGDPAIDSRLVAQLDSVATLRAHAAVLRSLKHRPGRAEFLLALFARAERLGLREDRMVLAAICFDEQPEAIATDLLDLARTSPNAEHRHRALAALAFLPLPEAVEPLCTLVSESPLPLAESAAYALAKQDVAVIRARINPRDLQNRRGYLFAAVLADCGALPAHIFRAEHAEGFLHHGKFSRAQFSIAAAELRRSLATRAPNTDS